MAIPIHIAGVVVVTSLHVVLTVALRMGTYWVFGESLDSWLHEAQEMLFLNFDWEMMTYWTIVGVGTALSYMHEARARELNAAQLETRLVEARLHTLAAADAAALPLQHAQYHLGADASRRGRGRRR